MSTLADWASILGLISSAYVAVGFWRLSRKWLFAGRIDDHRRQLIKNAESLNRLLAGSTFTFTDCTPIFAELKSTLNELASNGTGRISKNSKKASTSIAIASKNRKRDPLFDFCEDLNAAVREIEADLNQEIKNRKISPKE